MFGLSPLRLGIYAVCAVALIGLLWKAHASIKESGREEIRTAWLLDNERLERESRELVEKAKQEAEEQRKADEAERSAVEQRERESQAERAKKDHALIASLDRRYKEALVNNQSCAVQMQQVLLCPVQ
jgi:septal ring factor EnvC (AmiA/AmiB activator)